MLCAGDVRCCPGADCASKAAVGRPAVAPVIPSSEWSGGRWFHALLIDGFEVDSALAAELAP